MDFVTTSVGENRSSIVNRDGLCIRLVVGGVAGMWLEWSKQSYSREQSVLTRALRYASNVHAVGDADIGAI